MSTTGTRQMHSLRLPSRPTGSFRTDVQALRAIAVVCVLLYHLWPNRLPGGFIGVDVFFVISGFLITSHLVRERDVSGRIAVATFWARRAARLLPASLLVLVTVSVAVLAWVPQSLWEQFFKEIGASALYVQNWNLLANSVDYLAATNTPSPVQHFWTLSVEEQFYFFLPLLLIGSSYLVRRVRWQTVCFTVVALITTGSFVFNIWLTSWSASEAYFSTLTRAWEFGAGAVLAFHTATPRIQLRVRNAAAGFGILVIIAGSMFLSSETPYPGAAALIPVVGTLLVIASGANTFVNRIGALRPVAFVGRISYAIYLWHWAIIVVLPYVTGHALTTSNKVVIVALSFALAWASTTYVEDPLRTSPRFFAKRRPLTVAGWMALGMAGTLAIPISAAACVQLALQESANATSRLVAAQPHCFGAKALYETNCDMSDLSNLPFVPSATAAKGDDGNRIECWSGTDSEDLNVCTLGPTSGYSKHLIAIGDSHNNSLVAAYERIAKSHNWRIDVAGHAGCYWTTEMIQLDSPEATKNCATWRAEATDFIRGNVDVAGIIVTRSSSGRVATEQEVDGLVSAWSTRPAGTAIIAIGDNPAFPENTTQCVEEDVRTAQRRCSLPRKDVTFDEGLERAAARDADAVFIDPTGLYCSEFECSPVVGHVLVYRDGRHITETYSTTIAVPIGDRIADALKSNSF